MWRDRHSSNVTLWRDRHLGNATLWLSVIAEPATQSSGSTDSYVNAVQKTFLCCMKQCVVLGNSIKYC